MSDHKPAKITITRKRMTTWMYPPGHGVWRALGDADSVTVLAADSHRIFGAGRAFLLPDGGWVMDYQVNVTMVKPKITKAQSDALEELFG